MYKWKPPSLNELIQIVFNMELTHLGSEASKHILHHLFINTLKIDNNN